MGSSTTAGSASGDSMVKEWMYQFSPRPTQLERFRQRFMHKLVYFPDNNDGIFGCVGCGRCLAKCPIHMNIVKVVKTLGEETT